MFFLFKIKTLIILSPFIKIKKYEDITMVLIFFTMMVLPHTSFLSSRIKPNFMKLIKNVKCEKFQ